MRSRHFLMALGLALAPVSAVSEAHDRTLPDLVMQPNAERVTFEHIDALDLLLDILNHTHRIFQLQRDCQYHTRDMPHVLMEYEIR